MDTVRAVIFDLDDTLYSYEAADEVAFAAVADYAKKRFGLEPERTRELHDQCFARQKRELGDDNAGIHSRIVRFEKFLEELKKPVFPHALNLTDLYWNTFLENMDLDPDVPALFAALKKAGVQTGLGTNMTSFIQYRKLEVLGIAGAFDFVVMSEEAGLEKPDPAFFALCAAKAGAEPRQCIFIGDNHPMDYNSEKNAGMYGIWRRLDRRIPEGTPEEETVGEYRSCLLPSGIRFGNAFIPY